MKLKSESNGVMANTVIIAEAGWDMGSDSESDRIRLGQAGPGVIAVGKAQGRTRRP
jgi:hypothetical protein